VTNPEIYRSGRFVRSSFEGVTKGEGRRFVTSSRRLMIIDEAAERLGFCGFCGASSASSRDEVMKGSKTLGIPRLRHFITSSPLRGGGGRRSAPTVRAGSVGCRFRRKPAGYSDLMSATIPI
jgi:hypothetical protein